MYAILQYANGHTTLVECGRFFVPNFLPKGVVKVDYYHGKLGGAKKMAHKLANKNKVVVRVKPDVKSGNVIKNSWQIMEEMGYPLG